MAEIVNLNRARKAKARADKDAAAVEHRVKFGRSKAEKAKQAAEKAMAQKIVDAHKRDS